MLKNEFYIHKNQDAIRDELPLNKKKFIDKHSLVLTERMMWISLKENSFPRKIFRHQFLLKSDIIGLVFRINEICFAKLNYFRENISQMEPYVYDCVKGFCQTELWDAEFFRHKPSGIMIDIRSLQRVKQIEEFKKFCMYLDAHSDYE